MKGFPQNAKLSSLIVSGIYFYFTISLKDMLTTTHLKILIYTEKYTEFTAKNRRKHNSVLLKTQFNDLINTCFQHNENSFVVLVTKLYCESYLITQLTTPLIEGNLSCKMKLLMMTRIV